jgi:hypothetical protein
LPIYICLFPETEVVIIGVGGKSVSKITRLMVSYQATEVALMNPVKSSR